MFGGSFHYDCGNYLCCDYIIVVSPKMGLLLLSVLTLNYDIYAVVLLSKQITILWTFYSRYDILNSLDHIYYSMK